jgi:DNA primase
MAKFIDFDAVKQQYTIDDTAAALKLVMTPGTNQMRGPCPACKAGGDRALVITPAKSVFYCFGARKGGDQLALVAHIRDCSVKDAAEWLSGGNSTVEDTSTSSRKSTVPESENSQEGTRTFQPLTYLEPDHPAVEAVGFDPEVAMALGIGYAPKGIMRGTVAVPIRDGHGTLLGYIGVQEARLPPNFQTNVVKFPRSA